MFEVVAENEGVVAGYTQHVVAKAGRFVNQLVFGMFDRVNRILAGVQVEIYFEFGHGDVERCARFGAMRA